MRSLTPAILVVSLLTFDMSARSRVLPVSDPAAKPAETQSIGILNEVAIAPVSNDPAVHQTNPVIASDGDSFLVVWRESSNCCFWNDEDDEPGSLYAVRLNTRGEPSGPPTLVSSSALSPEPGLAFDGTHYLLVWYETDGSFPRLVGQKFTVDAMPVDVEPFLIIHDASPAGGIGLTCGEDDCLTIFRRGVALLSKQGAVLRVDLGSGTERSDVIATSNGYAATLPMEGELLYSPYGVIGPSYLPALADFPRGSVDAIDPMPLLEHWERSGSVLTPGIQTSIAMSGSSILTAWSEEFEFVDGRMLVRQVPSDRRERRFWSDPMVITAPAIDGKWPTLRDPELAWVGSKFLLAFQTSNESSSRPLTKGDIAGLWIAEDGSAVDSIFKLTSSEEVESIPSLAVNDRRLIALAFVRGIGETAGSTNSRLFVTMLSDSANRSRPVRR